jgi:dihydroorotase
MLDLCLLNCKLLPENIKCSIGIENGKIISIKKLPSPADLIIDIGGKLVLPGLIDAHVHLRDPGLTYKEDFRTGTSAASAGGYTTVLDMPNTNPPTTTPQAFKEKLKFARKKSLVDFGLHAGIDDLELVKQLAELRPASFKIFMDVVKRDFLMEAFATIKGLNKDHLITLHAEDYDMVEHCTNVIKKQGSQPALYAQARAPRAEFLAVKTAISLASHYKQKIHLCHLSTRKSLKLLENTQKEGLATAEITPHHLFLDTRSLEKYGTIAKTNPPLRDLEHKLRLNDLSRLDIISTDHAPHTLEEKKQSIWEAPPGIPNLETTLSLLLTQYNQNKITITNIKRLLCEKPAEIFKLPGKGHIEKDMDADLVVIDLKQEGIIKPENFHSKAKYTPFEGYKFKGMPVMTLVRGNIVMKDNEILENQGKFVYNPNFTK